MKKFSLRSKLLLAISALVIGSGLLISLLVTQRYSNSLRQSAIVQGEYHAQSLAFETTDKILINDLVALQKLLNYHLSSNPSVAYLLVIRNQQVIAHTFPSGIPIELIGANTVKNNEQGNFQRIKSLSGEYYLDIAWSIFSGKAGILRLGLSEKPIESQIKKLWMQMTALTLGILVLALAASFLFIKRFTQPLQVLAEAAEEISEGNLEVKVALAGSDEVGRLAFSFNHMVSRIRDFTGRLEKNTIELDRAHRQTRSSLDIIQKIGEQSDLRDVCSYLIQKFQEIVACHQMVMLVFSKNVEFLFVFADGIIRVLSKEAFDKALPIFQGPEGITFVKKNVLKPPLVPASFQPAARMAVFPLNHENQLLGTLLVACPGGCKCDTKELEVIDLILHQTAGAIRRAASHEEAKRELENRIEVTTEFSGIVGKDPKMQTIYKLIEDIAPTEATVMIQGESGTGKELISRAIHKNSLRKDGPFVVINCSAYPSTLLESELFGHEKGAFTGAVRQKIGRFEQAHGGTVFLDEIGEVPASSQIKLLRVLQTQKFERLGGEKTLAVDARIISATNKNLIQEVKRGNFREDLYYRLNVIPINLPPLRKRRNDIPLQARYFLRRSADEQGKEVRGFSSEAMRILLDYPWPGNVRELENSIEHAVVLAKGVYIEVSDLPTALRQEINQASMDGRSTITENEAKLLKEALDESNWNKKEAARRLGISRNTLYRKLKKYQINPPTLH
ncbi:MAG: sigma 54-interacting transcriptional regulator [Desulfobacterales bacterium]|jgi:two-component system response regulator HydG